VIYETVKMMDTNFMDNDLKLDEPYLSLLIDQIRSKNLTYLSVAKLHMLAKTCISLHNHKIPGKFIEAGCALGGSAILISKMKNRHRELEIYDVFGMIPPPSEEDPPEVHQRYKIIAEGRSRGINGDRYYGYVHNLLEVVNENFIAFDIDLNSDNVRMVQGMLQDTLHPVGPIALAHIDVDWYDSVLTCLQRIEPHLSVGGCIILDDYNDWGGCRKATDIFLASTTLSFSVDSSARSLKITRL